MNVNYEEVPNIITGKDLDYLSDMFHWNYGCYKKCCNGINEVQDESIKEMIKDASDVFLNHMNEILEILGGHLNEQ